MIRNADVLFVFDQHIGALPFWGLWQAYFSCGYRLLQRGYAWEIKGPRISKNTG